ncbi:MAG: sugar phosphate isomerase/epimerase, partial [Deltaproteobacteria bacterium]|nr:sugar phosphate isomerase/epimerase [Deltaproteobacteria bacterium]
KLFSTDAALAGEAAQAVRENYFSFIELYAVPGSFQETAQVWKSFSFPCIVHGPHFGAGVNLADAARKDENRRKMEDALRFADALNAPYVIVHGGFGGPLEELVEQTAAMRDDRFILENTPKLALNGETCTAHTPEHLQTALGSGVFAGCVLDVGHALYAANSLNEPWEAFLRRFLALRPVLFHLSDGDGRSEKDVHASFGKGDFDLRGILALLPKGAKITLETPRSHGTGLRDAIQDSVAIRRYLPS